MKTLLGTVVFHLAFTFSAEATEQECDVLIIRGKRIHTHDAPGLKEAFPKLSIPEFRMISTANYKGYSATWAVFDGQLYLVGLEALTKDGSELLWDEKVLKKQSFPLKVDGWSGVVKQSSPVWSSDLNTGKSESYDEVTTITFEKGKVTNVDFDRKVARESNTEKKSK